MLVKNIMKVLKNLFGLNKKISASEIAIKDSNNNVYTLDDYLKMDSRYSTNEVVIGIWIDGKPLYRKTIIFTDTISFNTVYTINVDVDNVNEIWIDTSNSFVYNNNASVESGNRSCYPIPFNIAPDTDEYLTAKIYGKLIKLQSNSGWNTNWTKVITIKYTKTTD